MTNPEDGWDEPVSWTKASTYDRCGRQFRYKYVEDIEEEVESEAKIVGQDFHEYMDEYYGLCPDGPNASTAVTLAKEMWNEKRQAKYRPYVEKWHQWNEWLYEKFGDDHWKPVFTEKWVEVEIDGQEHRGYIDAIRWDPDRESYGVVDYKPKAKDNSRIKGQVAYYGDFLLEVADLLDEDVEWGGTYGYKDGNYRTWDIHWASSKATQRKIDSLVALDNGYEPNFGFHCKFCSYQERCTMEEEQENDRSSGSLI